mgnify:CR=1 FL=1
MSKKKKRQEAQRQNEYCLNPHEIPEGALPIDVEKLSEKSWDVMSSSPRVLEQYYQTKHFHCQKCDKKFKFTALEQKRWYEEEKRFLDQHPIYCDEHYKEWNRSKGIKEKMDNFLESLKNDEQNLELQKKCAEAILEYYNDTEKGNTQLVLQLIKTVKVDESYSTLIQKIRGL